MKSINIRALSKLERECERKSSLEFYNDFYIQNGPQLYLSHVSFKRERLKLLTRINAMPLNGTLHRMHIRPNGFCQLCNENSIEGLDHFLLSCSFYDNEREIFLLDMRASLVKTSGQAVYGLFVDLPTHDQLHLLIGDTGHYIDSETYKIFDDTGKDMLETFWCMRQIFIKENLIPFNLISFHFGWILTLSNVNILNIRLTETS